MVEEVGLLSDRVGARGVGSMSEVKKRVSD